MGKQRAGAGSHREAPVETGGVTRKTWNLNTPDGRAGQQEGVRDRSGANSLRPLEVGRRRPHVFYAKVGSSCPS